MFALMRKLADTRASLLALDPFAFLPNHSKDFQAKRNRDTGVFEE